MRGPDHEEIEVHRGADHRHSAGAGSRCEDSGAVPSARDQQRDLLRVEGQVRRDGRVAKRLKALEEENGRLKRLLAESLLDQAALKDLLSRKW